MDPFLKYIQRKKERGLTRGIFVLLALLCLIVGLIFGYLIHWGGFHLEVQLHGDSEITLRYGEQFEDPGCDAVFKGTHFFPNGEKISVTHSGCVDTKKLGTYEITYGARFGFWKGEAKRTVRIVDRVKPVILLNSDPGTYVQPGKEYEEEGFLACDNYDGNLNDQVKITRYRDRIVYSVTDSSGNSARAERQIVYYDPVHPEIILAGEPTIILAPGQNYEEPGFTATDNLEGDLTDRVQITGSVNSYQTGSYTITYTVKDRFGNQTTKSRIVKVEANFQPEIIVPEGKVIYLTFDDGPGKYTRELLDILKKYDVKATFFVCKTDFFELCKDIVDEGHSIGIHSVTHNYKKIYSSEEAYFKDLNKMRELIKETCGVETTLVRFPGGSSNTVSKFNKGIMTRLTKALTDMGYQYYDWDVNSGDAGETVYSKEVFSFVKAGVQKQDVSIVLQHDIKKFSVAAVEDIIIWGRENGYRFLPLDPTSPNAHHKIQN